MPITDFLEKNARLYPNDVALVELNPANQPESKVTWREYNLIETPESGKYRREMTWREFDRKGKPVCQSPVYKRREEGRQGRHSSDELPRMAAGVFRYFKDRRHRRADELPV